MATAIGYPLSSLRLNEIPKELQDGIDALKWPEELQKPRTPNKCHLSIDPKGFYLICHDKIKNTIECFDIALIHDTRTGTQVSLPPGAESFDHRKFGVLDVAPISKWVTIYYGHTFVATNDLRTIHFCFESPSIAQKWTDQLFQLGHNLYLRNLSSLECLEKVHSYILHALIDVDKKRIPVKSLIQFLCKNNRDFIKETKIRQSLEYIQFPCQDGLVIRPEQFTFTKFFQLYMHLMDRQEIRKLFDSLGGQVRRYICADSLKGFIKRQNDVRSDPSDTDPYEQKAKDLIKKYNEHDAHLKDKGMCEESFLRYLLSSDNSVIDPKIIDLSMDMSKPLSHYFIASSHNTYLTGSQFTGRANIEMYRQVLLTGCRCIELDVVDCERKNDEPEIKHVYTPVRPVPFIDVIFTIREYAFKVTPYPLILSIENHCGPKAQAKMAQYLVDLLGDYLLTKPLPTHPCEENCPLPSPDDLKYKILIKNKKIQTKLPSNNQNVQTTIPKCGTISASSSGEQSDPCSDQTAVTQLNISDPAEESEKLFKKISSVNAYLEEGRDRSATGGDEDFSDEDEMPPAVESQPTVRESKATKDMSALVNYIAPVRFKTFAIAEQRNRSFEVSSFREDLGYNAIRDHAKEFLAYNYRQLSRIYPRGKRIESSNYNPFIFWKIGCQMVALNYQTLDTPMQLNLGLFSLNGACGFIEKPVALCQRSSLFDPRIRKNVENVISCQIDIKVLSGQFLCQDREPTYVDIHMYGLYGDINEKCQHRVRIKRWNGFQAIYDDNNMESSDSFKHFPKVILPDMAALRFSVTAEDGFVGQCFLPIAHLRTGYHHITLRNQINIPVNSSSLFVYIRKTIPMDSKEQEFADKLAEPLLVYPSKLNNDAKQKAEFSPHMLVRFHPTPNECQEERQRRSSSVASDESSSYQKHVIAGSELNNTKSLCQILSLNDIDPKTVQKQEQSIQNKLRRVSVDYQSRIDQENRRLTQYLNSQQSEPVPTNNTLGKRQTTGAINKKPIEQTEESLLKLYAEKLHQQEELEFKHINEYYNKLEKEIRDDYNKHIDRIHYFLQKDKARVKEHVSAQIKREMNDITKKETDKNKIVMLKQRISEENTKIRALTFQKLEEMREENEKILDTNLQTNLNQLHEQKSKAIERCFTKYRDLFSQVKLRLKRQIDNDEHEILHDNSAVLSRPRFTSASTSAILQYPSEGFSFYQQTRRQTIDE